MRLGFLTMLTMLAAAAGVSLPSLGRPARPPYKQTQADFDRIVRAEEKRRRKQESRLRKETT